MEDYPSNTRSDQDARKTPRPTRPTKAPEKRVAAPVVDGSKVVRRKKPLGRRMSETFFGTDAKSVAGFVVMDVFVPAAKDLIVDMVTQGIERSLFGDVRGSRSRAGRPGDRTYVSYGGASRPSSGRRDPRDDPRPSLSRRSRAQHEFDEIILGTRVEAEEVLDRLYDILNKYETASVADLYELLDITANPVDEKWGWDDLRGSGVIRRRDGYLLNLPSPVSI